MSIDDLRLIRLPEYLHTYNLFALDLVDDIAMLLLEFELLEDFRALVVNSYIHLIK
jgi:hypothetical protein